MAQVSIGQVENLKELARGLLFVREALESACREQIATANRKNEEAHEEALNSDKMLKSSMQQEQETQQAFENAQENLKWSQSALSVANSVLSACEEEANDEDSESDSCDSEESDVAEAEDAVEQAQAKLELTQKDLEVAKQNHQAMEQRMECAKQALAMAEQAMEQSQVECTSRFTAVAQSVDLATARLTTAQHALNAYLAINPPASQFHSWLNWSPAQHGDFITPDTLRDRMNLSAEQRVLLQEYLYDRNPAYRGMVDKYRGEWVAAKGDAERNIVARKTRIHLCGEFGEQIARHAIAPLGRGVETQRRTFVGDKGRYTKTDLLVTGLRVPVILGRGKGMGALAGGSMAFEVKCGTPDYLYSQKDHMVFQAEGHKQADAQCTLCSRDIHDLPPEKEKELRDSLRDAGSPLVGMLPRKNEIDQSCIGFIRLGEE